VNAQPRARCTQMRETSGLGTVAFGLRWRAVVWSGLGDLCQSAGMRSARVVVVAGPAVVLAGLGLTHPY
jgi:hypothetical protein